MTPVEYLFLTDLQQKGRVCACSRCGREIYAPGGACIYCARFRG